MDRGSLGIQPRSCFALDSLETQASSPSLSNISQAPRRFVQETPRSWYPRTTQGSPKTPARRHDPNRHPNTHLAAPQPQYYCRVCRGLFSWKHRHMMNVHILPKRFHCEHCERGYTRKDNLKHHIREKHPKSSELFRY
ncbi:uncharacterized protein P884DRAFT_257119 [Thermothelomyces heterothallicus CBS 202.75]|uniref:uncharacterized protein n=1 Tax=Thermothelomyces heterothallicus CBS 202.75 TaxID=1149848 RepID=UPI003743C152